MSRDWAPFIELRSYSYPDFFEKSIYIILNYLPKDFAI
jgi:hypothetical protein